MIQARISGSLDIIAYALVVLPAVRCDCGSTSRTCFSTDTYCFIIHVVCYCTTTIHRVHHPRERDGVFIQKETKQLFHWEQVWSSRWAANCFGGFSLSHCRSLTLSKTCACWVEIKLQKNYCNEISQSRDSASQSIIGAVRRVGQKVLCSLLLWWRVPSL